MLVQGGIEAAFEAPVLGEDVGRGIEPQLHAGEIGGAERRDFQHGRPVHWGGQGVGEALHAPVAGHHAAAADPSRYRIRNHTL